MPWATIGLPRHDLYLLTSHEDVPWHDDGLREGDLAIRAAMTGWFAGATSPCSPSARGCCASFSCSGSRLAGERAVDADLGWQRAWPLARR